PLEMDRYSQLQQLSKSLVESASDLKDLKGTLKDKTRDIETLLLQQGRVNTELQESLMRTRTVPLSRAIVPRLRRTIRQVSGELDKPVTFDIGSSDGELDRTIIERMVAPLEHVLRNAIDHGIETVAARKKAGKPETGSIRLDIHREGSDVVLRLSDDGKGVDVAAVRKKALSLGLIQEGDDPSDDEIKQFILSAGFSTASKVTQISGRGVGMDVVQKEIHELGGTLELVSEQGVGTTFIFRLPFTVSMNRALLVSAGGETLAVPLDSIEGIVRVSPYELEEYYGDAAVDFMYAGQRYDFRYLGSLINNSEPQYSSDMVGALPVLLVRSGDKLVAFQVDRLLGSREIVVKSLGPQFARIEGVSGATVLGDGSVVMIADLTSLVRHEEALTSAAGAVMMPQSDSRECPLVMVVDDSVTVRKVTTRLLEREGFEVITAKDGLDAMEKLEDICPDIMLCDIEMPRLDGFEVVTRVRNEERLAKMPIIMISSRTGDKHTERALSLGANDFLGKPYQDKNLLGTINNYIAAPGSVQAVNQ
ncbi:MAG: hybrid sensor histidine kinase/response regulator, partial [Pseudomonadales bacterium]